MRIWAIIILLAVCSCRSQKHAVAQQSAVSVETERVVEQTKTEKAVTFSQVFAAVCDSLSVRFSADSIHTADGGTVFRPILSVSASAPVIIAREDSAAVESYAAASSADTAKSGASSSNVSDDKDTVAIAQPADPTWLTGLSLLGLVLLAAIAYFAKKRMDKQT